MVSRRRRPTPANKSGTQRLVTNAFWLGAFFTEALFPVRFVFLIIPVEEGDLRVTFERQNVGGDAVEEAAVVGDHQHAAIFFYVCPVQQRGARPGFSVMIILLSRTARSDEAVARSDRRINFCSAQTIACC